MKGFIDSRSLWRIAILAATAVLLLSACQSVGPGRIPPDNFSYNESLGRTANEQMLLNLVRLRHIEVPVFLTIGSVVTGYSWNRSLGVSVGAAFSPSFDVTSGDVNPNLSFSENPTITYTPLTGQAFTERMLKPLPLEGIFALGQSGWPVDLLLVMGIQSINEYQNLSFVSGPTVGNPDDLAAVRIDLESYTKFREVVDLLLELIQAGAIEFEHDDANSGGATRLLINPHTGPAANARVARFRELLRLDPSLDSYRVTDLRTRRKPGQIAIRVRSLVAVMSYLALGVDASGADIARGAVLGVQAGRERGGPGRSLPVPLTVHTAPERPQNAFVAVRYRGDWYYIDETDVRSKRSLAILNTLFSAQHPDSGGAAPVLTLPASR